MVATAGLVLAFFEGDEPGGCVCFLLGGISEEEEYNSNEYKCRHKSKTAVMVHRYRCVQRITFMQRVIVSTNSYCVMISQQEYSEHIHVMLGMQIV